MSKLNTTVIRCTHCGSYEYKKIVKAKVIKIIYVRNVIEVLVIE